MILIILLLLLSKPNELTSVCNKQALMVLVFSFTLKTQNIFVAVHFWFKIVDDGHLEVGFYYFYYLFIFISNWNVSWASQNRNTEKKKITKIINILVELV